MHHPTDRIAHTTAFVTPFVEHWLEEDIAQWVFYANLHIIMKEMEMFYLTMHSTHLNFSVIWRGTFVNKYFPFGLKSAERMLSACPFKVQHSQG